MRSWGWIWWTAPTFATPPRSAAPCEASTPSATRRRRSASARTVADAPEYVSHNDFGTAVAPRRDGRGRSTGAGVRLVDGGLRRGPVRVRRARLGPSRPARARKTSTAGAFEPPCPICGEPLAPGLVGEDAPLDPRNVYAASKVMTGASGGLVGALADGVRAVALRYHNVYGPRLPRDTPYAGVAALFRSALDARRGARGVRGRRPAARLRARARRRDRERGRTGVGRRAARCRAGDSRAYNVGSGTPRTVGEMAAELARAMSGPAPVVTGGYRLGDVRHITASSARIRADLGWRPSVEFADGVAEFALTHSLT